MKLVEVKTDAQKREFLDVARQTYKDDPVWVCPLDSDIDGVFDSRENNYYEHGEAIRWILTDDAGKSIGRIAAFYDRNSFNNPKLTTGGCGFFECIDDRAAAHLLFDTAKEWLTEKGMQAMDGPVNFGETDKYWGLLVKGFTHPAYQIAYNPPYYQELFESYGFQVYFKQEGFHLDIKKGVPERFKKIAERVVNNPEYSFEHFKWSEADRYANDFTTVFNEAWKDFKKDFEPLDVEYVHGFLKRAKVLLEEKFIWFAYKDGEPIGIYFMYPDFNQLFKPFKGKLNLVNKLRLLWASKQRRTTRARGVLMGIVPEYQGRGVEVGFVHHVEKALQSLPEYTELEFSWVGDFNPRMRKIWAAVGADSAKHYITYRYMFDPNAPYERYPIPE